MRRGFGILLLIGAVSCGEDTGPNGVGGDGACEIEELPVQGSSNAPLVTDVALEVQDGGGIVLHATASDPQGDDDLIDVPQIIRVFQDPLCETSPIVLQDDLAASGVQENFGTAVERGTALYDAIAAAESWPVEVDFRDADDNTTSAQVLARVFQ
ncbi:MAG TPA: hypothetical protein VHH32_08185 [Gemmatimonadales bacterium]|nr:hypothetical protein [Gemmatimonadales bacterium]